MWPSQRVMDNYGIENADCSLCLCISAASGKDAEGQCSFSKAEINVNNALVQLLKGLLEASCFKRLIPHVRSGCKKVFLNFP